LNVTNLDTEVSKFTALLALSQEFIDMAPELATRVIGEALSEAVARGVDGYLLGKLNAASSEESDSNVNPTFAEMMEALSELLLRIQVGERSRLFFVLQPRSLKYLSAMAYAAGVTTIKYNGGEVMGVSLVGSDSQSSGTVTLCDASAIAYGSDGIKIRTSELAALELSDSATGSSDDPTAVQLTSCFQTNTRAVLAEERVAIRVADTGAVASLTGTQWGVGEGSPQGF
jgi:hypothetical protein